jgi:hypothetical protein
VHARAAEGPRDKTGRLRLAIRPKLLAGADLDYPTDRRYRHGLRSHCLLSFAKTSSDPVGAWSAAASRA